MKNQKLKEIDVLRGDFLRPEEMFLLEYMKDFDRKKAIEYRESAEDDFDLEFEN